MCFSATKTRNGDKPTVAVEGAPSSGPRVYDWNRKVSFQLTVSELSLLLGVLMGFTSKVDFQGHGVANEKSLSIENQGDKFFMSMRVRGLEGKEGCVFAMPVLPKDTIILMGLLYRQLRANMGEVSDGFMMNAVRRVCEMTAPPKGGARNAA
jgi:hypothetical protein